MTTLADSSSSEQDFITFEWIENLPLELKNQALYKYVRISEIRLTLAESLVLDQVMYRTVTGNTFTESAESVAQRTGHDRKTILKGLNQAVEQNILQENKRPGTSSEYSFKPVEEWLHEPVVHKTDIRTNQVIEFPTIHNTDSVETEQQLHSNDGVVRSRDDLETDTNMLLFNNLLEQQQLEVSVRVEDTPKSHWKYVGQGIPRVYMPPELDADTGMKIEFIHSATKEPRQFIIKNAVELLYNEINRIPSDLEKLPSPTPFQRVDVVVLDAVKPVSTIPDEVMKTLFEAGIHLTLSVAERLWLKYPESFLDAIAYTIQQSEAGKIKQSLEGFFRKSLEEGWSFSKPQSNNKLQKPVSTSSLTEEQLEWYLWAVREGICLPAAINELPIKMGRVCAKVQIANPRPFDPPYDLRPIEELMREFPM